MKTHSNRAKQSPWLIGMCGVFVAGVLATVLVQSPQAQSTSDGPLQVPSIQGPVSFAEVVEAVSPAVVNISVEKVERLTSGRMPGFSGRQAPLDEFFGRFFGGPNFPGAPNVPQERRAKGLGSGFVVDPDGYIVTNNHVISDSDEVVVIFKNGNELKAEVVGYDTRTDLALLKVDASGPLPFVRFGDSDISRVGDWVLAIGNPFGLSGSATAGIISARGRDIKSGPYDDYLQIDAPINSGNSGGPVFNGAGQVIGVNTAIYSPNGGNIGIGFAIPARQAQLVIDELRDDGAVTRGWLGVQIQSLDEDLAEALGVSGERGALVSEIVIDGPADVAGIEAGDVILRLDGNDVDDPRHLGRLIGEADPGARIELEVLREGRSRELDVTLGDLDQASPMASASGNSAGQDASAQLAGMQFAELTAGQRMQLAVPDNISGVLVTAVEPGSAAAKKGVRPGDVITEVNNRMVDSPRAARAAMQAAANQNGRALVVLQRGEQKRYVAIGLS